MMGSIISSSFLLLLSTTMFLYYGIILDLVLYCKWYNNKNAMVHLATVQFVGFQHKKMLILFPCIFSRWDPEHQRTNESDLYQNDQVYNNMAETMSDLSNSYYSIKRGSIQMKNLNNNNKVTTSVPHYNMNNFYKNQPTTIWVGTKNNNNTVTTTTVKERSVDSYSERSVDEQPATCRIRVSSKSNITPQPATNERSVDTAYNERSVDEQPIRRTSQR